MISYFRLKYAGRTYDGDSKSQKRSLTYVAKATSAADNDDSVYAAGPFRIGDYYRVNSTVNQNLTCQRVQIRQNAGGERIWSAVYEFSTKDPSDGSGGGSGGGGGGGGEGLDVTKFLPRYAVRKEEKQVVAYADKGGVRITNSAGGMFAQPVMVPRSRLAVTVSRYERWFSAALAMTYYDAVNEDAFWGAKPDQVLCRSITASKIWERWGRGIYGYWDVSYELVFDREGFTLQVLDQGNYVLKSGSESGSGSHAQVEVPRDVRGIPMTGPFLLDGYGGMLAADKLGDPNQWHYLKFRVYDRAQFGSLNLPPPQ